MHTNKGKPKTMAELFIPVFVSQAVLDAWPQQAPYMLTGCRALAARQQITDRRVRFGVGGHQGLSLATVQEQGATTHHISLQRDQAHWRQRRRQRRTRTRRTANGERRTAERRQRRRVRAGRRARSCRTAGVWQAGRPLCGRRAGFHGPGARPVAHVRRSGFPIVLGNPR